MTRVRRRRVLYIPGYDPFPPRRYRELYRREGAAQAALSGYELALGRGDAPEAWTVTATMEGAQVETRVEVLVWSDIVAASMSHGIAATYAQLLRTAWLYVASGALVRLARLRTGPVIAALYPVVALLVQLAVAIVIGAGVVWIVSPLALVALGRAASALAAASGILAAHGVLRLFRRLDRRIFAHYLMHDYAFAARCRGATPPVLVPRLAAFADRIAEATTDADEVLVVGHSSGAHLGIPVLAGLIRAGRLPDGRVSFLTLGHVVPMISFLPGASDLRADLHLMGGQDVVPWVDVTAPGDGCAFALCDPVAVSGVAPARRTGPLILSAAFSDTLSPATRARLRRRYFRLHFQYLCAFDALPGRPDDYDYFRITAGPMTLADRFATRRDSPSTRRDAVSGYTATAA